MEDDIDTLRRKVRGRDQTAARQLLELARAQGSERDVLAAWSVLLSDRFYAWQAMRAALRALTHSASSTTRSVDSTNNIRQDVIARTLVDSFRSKSANCLDALAPLLAEVADFLLRHRLELRDRLSTETLQALHNALQEAIAAPDDAQMLSALRRVVSTLEQMRARTPG